MMKKPTIALFIHQPMCSIQSGNGIITALKDNYNFKIFTKHELEENFFDGIDMIVFPGGFGDSDSFYHLLRVNQPVILNYLKNGGRYLGICMGAYWAGHHYFNIVNNIDVVQYYKRPRADVRRPHTKALSVEWNGNNEKMFFNDGCALIGDTTKFDVIAKYANGEPMAIIQNKIGLIGCHPESEKFWFDSYSQTRGMWHAGRHHLLLRNFADKLMQA
jgi:glutamine amidotransferase-like uncharacterized protein